MDPTKFTFPSLVLLVGAAVLLVFGFFDWIEVSAFGFSNSGGNVFDFFWTGSIPWLLIMTSATIVVLRTQNLIRSESAPWPLLILVATGVGALLLLIRLIFNPLEGADVVEAAGGSVGRTTWMVLAVAGGVVAAVGGLLGYGAEGGTLEDLTDADRLRESFPQRNDDPLPPPPAPPPPPPATP